MDILEGLVAQYEQFRGAVEDLTDQLSARIKGGRK
jgi:hypothetical protein